MNSLQPMFHLNKRHLPAMLAILLLAIGNLDASASGYPATGYYPQGYYRPGYAPMPYAYPPKGMYRPHPRYPVQYPAQYQPQHPAYAWHPGYSPSPVRPAAPEQFTDSQPQTQQSPEKPRLLESAEKKTPDTRVSSDKQAFISQVLPYIKAENETILKQRDWLKRTFSQISSGNGLSQVDKLKLSALAKKYRVDMPISEQVYRVLHDQLSPADAVRNLLAREVKPESVG